MTDDCATSHSKPSVVESQLDTEVSDSSDVTTAGSDDEMEPDLVNAPLLRSTDGGIRDESTRQCPVSAVKRTRLGLTDPRSSHILLLLVCVSFTIIGQPRNSVLIRRV